MGAWLGGEGHFVCVRRENRAKLSLNSFIKYVCETEQLERIIAFRSNKDESHFTKWDKLIPLLE